MKKLLFLFIAVILCLSSCGKFDNEKELKGKVFTYFNGYYDSYKLKSTYIFKNNGDVIWESTVGYSSKATFDHLKYRLNGSTIEICRDNSTHWKKEARGTVFQKGTYNGTTITIDGLIHKLE